MMIFTKDIRFRDKENNIMSMFLLVLVLPIKMPFYTHIHTCMISNNWMQPANTRM